MHDHLFVTLFVLHLPVLHKLLNIEALQVSVLIVSVIPSSGSVVCRTAKSFDALLPRKVTSHA